MINYHQGILKIHYMLITSKALSSLDLYILRVLIVMIIWQCSYRDVEAYYLTDIVVR
jgi:hypothetical protein